MLSVLPSESLITLILHTLPPPRSADRVHICTNVGSNFLTNFESLTVLTKIATANAATLLPLLMGGNKTVFAPARLEARESGCCS